MKQNRVIEFEKDTILAETKRKQVVVCGLETHICVSQTALDLASNGYFVHVTPDACTSHTIELHKLGMERMRDSGVIPAAAESVVYEWLETSKANEFGDVLEFVKTARSTV